MSGIIGQGNGLSFPTNQGLKQLDKDTAPSPPPVEPNYKTGTDAVAQDSAKLEAMLIQRGMSQAEARAKIQSQSKSTGVRYK